MNFTVYHYLSQLVDDTLLMMSYSIMPPTHTSQRWISAYTKSMGSSTSSPRSTHQNRTNGNFGSFRSSIRSSVHSAHSASSGNVVGDGNNRTVKPVRLQSEVRSRHFRTAVCDESASVMTAETETNTTATSEVVATTSSSTLLYKVNEEQSYDP